MGGGVTDTVRLNTDYNGQHWDPKRSHNKQPYHAQRFLSYAVYKCYFILNFFNYPDEVALRNKIEPYIT